MRLLPLLVCFLSITSFAYSQTVIYTEDFSNGFPSDYTQQTNASDGGWNTGNASSLQSQYFSIDDQGSGQIIATNDDACDCDKSNDLLITDSIDLTSYTSNTVFLRFDKFYFNGDYQNNQEQATVEISTDGGNNWTQVKDIDGGIWLRESVDISSYAGQHIKIGFRYNDDGGWLYGWALDNIQVEEPIDYDIILDSLIAPSNHKIGTNSISMDATITNNGGQTITSFDINYVVNGDTTTDNISGVSIDPLDDYTFTIPTGFSPSSTGEYDVTAFPSNINGNPDQEPSNNIETGNILVYDTSYQRKPLYEVFTSSTCGPCQPGNENFEDIMSNYPGEGVTVKFQQDFPGVGDPYATSESVTRRQSFYGITGIPNMQIDGGWDGNANAFTASLHETAADRPAFVKIDAEYQVWPDSQKVEVCYEIIGLKNYQNKTLYASINEDTTSNNVGSNGETEFYNVFKKWFPGSGQSININTSNSIEDCMTYTFNGNYRLPNNANDMINHSIEHSVEEFTDLKTVIWVQDDQTKNVHQATYGKKIVNKNKYNYIVGPKANNFDLAMDTVTTVSNASLNTDSISIDASLYNNGIKTINSFDIHYVVNGNVYTDNVTGTSITSRSNYITSYKAPFNPSSVGTEEIVAYTSNVNGNTDQLKDNDTSRTTVIVDTTTSIVSTDKQPFHFTLFPNPAKNQVSVSYNSISSSQKVKFTIHSIKGKKIRDIEQKTANNRGTLSINCHDLSNGVYLFKMKAGEQVQYEKLIIQQ